MPTINWEKYGLGDNQESVDKLTTNSNTNEIERDIDNSNILIRGRTFNESKPETFNQVCCQNINM